MTDLDSMTLGELESVAARVRKAADDIRAAQALFSGGAASPLAVINEPVPAAEEDAAAAHRRRQFQAVEMGAPRALQRDPRATLSPGELAERQRLLARATPVDKNLPEDMQAMERE